MAKVKFTRTSCGYCTQQGSHRHQHCPGSLPRARAGKEWVCWCSENGHPEVLPKAPTVTVDDDDAPAPAADDFAQKVADTIGEPYANAEPKPAKSKGEKAPRCGHPTSKGPCKRVQGHTRGHDAR